MKRCRKMIGLLMAGLLLANTVGCKGMQQDEEKQLKIGVVYYDKSDTFIGALYDSFKSTIEKIEEESNDTLNISIVLRTSDSSQRIQNEQITELLNSGCDVLCVNLVDRTDPSQIIDEAREKNVPVIFFNKEPVSEDMHQWDKLYYVGSDAAESGIMQGEIMAEYIKNHPVDKNHDGIISYVVLEGEAGHQDAIVRTENAVSTLKSQGIELEKLSCQIANWSRAQAQNRMEQMMAQYKNKIELVIANNDDMALGAIDAYTKLNYTEESFPAFFGVDGTDVGLEAYKEGKLNGTVYNDKEGQAENIARLAVALGTNSKLDGFDFEDERYISVPYKNL